jgi:putative hemin transport protein
VIEVTGTPKRFAPQPQVSRSPEKDAEERARTRDIVGGYFGPPIDLRFTFNNWQYAFAVTPEGRDPSLQFFNAQGRAVHKVFLRQEENRAVFDKLVADFRNANQSADFKLAAQPAKTAEKPDSAIDVKELQLAWSEITNVHQFARLLQEFGVSREQAMRLAPAGAVERLQPSAVRTLLQNAAARGEPIMAFVGNEGVTEIFSGKIKFVEEKGGFFNVLNPDFNLHLLDSKFKSGWIARRAGLSSVEFYDNEGTLVVTFFSYRPQGKPQPESWNQLLSTLPRAGK